MTTHLPHLGDDFYAQHPRLSDILRAARNDRTSPDAVLLATLARVATLIPVAATVNGQPVNLIAALVGASGSGKSSSHRTARRLIPDVGTDRDGIGVGTGEGIAMAFLTREKSENVQARDAVLFWCDEGETLLKVGRRDGSTTLATLRSAWDGDTLGQSNANVETTRIVRHGRYRFVMAIGLQPPFAAELLADQTAGTPQRFVWAASGDPNADHARPTWPNDLHVSKGEPCPFTVDAEVSRIVNDRRVTALRNGGHDDPEESHATQNQLRIAAILAHLLDDGGRHVTPQVWNIAGMIVENSRNVRRELARQHQQTTLIDAVDKAATRLAVVNDARDVVHDRKVERVGGVIVNYLTKYGTSTRSEVRRAVGRDRQHFDDALSRLIARRIVVVDRSTISLTS
jgi:hypothetical protein